MAFSIRVPTGKGDSSSGNSGGSKEQEKNNKRLKDNTRAVAIGNVIANGINSLLGDVLKMFQPMIRILSVIFFLGLLPLLPALVYLTEKLADFAGAMAAEGGGLKGITAGVQSAMKDTEGNISIWSRIITGIIGALVLGIAIVGAALIGLATGIPALIIVGITALITLLILSWEDYLLPAIKWIGEKLVQAFTFVIDTIANAATWIWESIISGFNFISGIGKAIWQFFLDGLSFISDLGKKIWDVIWEGLKGVSKLLIDGFKLIINGIISFINSASFGLVDIPQLANGGIVTKPTTALIGEAGPEAVIPLSKLGGMGTTNITINNPVIRNNSDIRKMTSAVSRELQKQGNRGFSSI